MIFHSTRNTSENCHFSAAIQQGLATDGGLFVPNEWPHIYAQHDWNQLTNYAHFAQVLLQPFLSGDPLATELSNICQRALNFPIPLNTLDTNTHVLELFHGPTLSFTDVGARFLAHGLSHIATQRTQPMTILVATSGDTGSAVAAAFHQQPNIRVVVLFPHGKISTRQQQQITCWGDNILPIAIDGTFDDCQRLVKTAFADNHWQAMIDLNTANSINLGRLLPQMSYYSYTSVQWQKQQQQALNLIIPSGNVGNATAAYWAKFLGFPIGEIILATNANATIPDCLKTGIYTPRASVETLANAMDVGNPSNFERLQYAREQPSTKSQTPLTAYSVTDAQIRAAIQDCYQRYKTIICPHTATAYYIRHHHADNRPWTLVATAHPSKFETIIEPLLDNKVRVPTHLQQLLDRSTSWQSCPATLDTVADCYRQFFG